MKFLPILLSLIIFISIGLSLGPNLILNPSFEDTEDYENSSLYWCDNYDPDAEGQWAYCEWSGDPDLINFSFPDFYLTSGDASDGIYSLVYNETRGEAGIEYNNPPLTDLSKWYIISFDVKPFNMTRPCSLYPTDRSCGAIALLDETAITYIFFNETHAYAQYTPNTLVIYNLGMHDIGNGWKRINGTIIYATFNISYFYLGFSSGPPVGGPTGLRYYLFDNAVIRETEIPDYNLTLQSTGEFVFGANEKTKVKIATLVTNSITGQPVTADVNATVDLYYPNGSLYLENEQMEQIGSNGYPNTGIYVFETNWTIQEANLPKGVFIASIIAVPVIGLGVPSYDVIAFHHDPAPEPEGGITADAVAWISKNYHSDTGQFTIIYFVIGILSGFALLLFVRKIS